MAGGPGLQRDILVWLLAATSAWILAGVLDKPGNGSDWLFTAARASSTCGWGCRSCWARWCTTSGTR